MQDAGLQGRWRGGGKGQWGVGEVVVVCGEMFVASPPWSWGGYRSPRSRSVEQIINGTNLIKLDRTCRNFCVLCILSIHRVQIL